MNRVSAPRSVAFVAGLVLLALLAAACGGTLESGALPTLAASPTAAPHATPTFPPLPDPADPPDVTWRDTAIHRQAMRPEFADDVDLFAERNRYVIDATLDLNDDFAGLYGSQRVRYTNRSQDTLTEAVFRLYPNLDAFSGQMNILNVTVNGTAVIPSYEQRRSVMRVPLPDGLPPGEMVELVVAFNSAIERGFAASYGEYSFQRGVFTAPEWYPVLSVYEPGHGWWTDRADNIQGEQTYTETGLYDVRLTTDADVTVILSGTEVETTDNGDGTITHRVVTGPMRDSILIASRTVQVVTGERDGITVNVYYWEDDDPEDQRRILPAAEVGLEMAMDALETFNRTFGDYPFNEFDMVQTNTLAGGIEYPGVIVVADRFWSTGANFFETVIAHEVGHQWFYSLIGNNQVAFPFLDESLTSYTEYVYFWELAADESEEQFARDYVRNEQITYNSYLGQDNPDLPLGLTTDDYFDFQYSMVIYTKGPLFFNELTELLGREQMYAVLQAYFRRYRYEVASIGGMLEVFEDVTGQQWDEMFYRWVGDFEGLDPAAIATVNALDAGG